MESTNSQDDQIKHLNFYEQKYITELLEKEDLDLKIFRNEYFNPYFSIKLLNDVKKKNIKGSLQPLW